ncbi:type I-U CRISPR-associated protein Csx17 [Embleya sp. NPDC050493]|uniref:type I-G CRISPR-associated protein Cas8g1/Csx17 n=1 Tax=Embleya sp. NPDC050493 TaxID=3363989 RepID=UPI00379BA0C5
MVNTIHLHGLRATTLAGYLSALGLLRLLTDQADTGARLHWHGDAPVLTTCHDPDTLADWLVDDYAPTPIVTPWNSGSGFNDAGKSVSAERLLTALEHTTQPRFAPLAEAIRVGRDIVAEGRRRGWAGETMWSKATKDRVITLCRNRLPDACLPWIDALVALGDDTLAWNPIAGTGGNFGRQELSATFHQRLALVAGPDADTTRSRAWARALVTGDETVPYLRDTVGQLDPGRAGGIHSSPWEKNDDVGFVNPWHTVLSCEGLVMFAGAAVRRNGAAGTSLPFMTSSSPVGHATAAAGETVKRELWAPIWDKPAGIGELEVLLGEGRARWRGTQARTGVTFALAVAALGVDRNLSGFRRFLFVERHGQNPLAVPAGHLPVAVHGEAHMVADAQAWMDRVRRASLPNTVATLLRQADAALFAVARGDGNPAVARFVTAFGLLHEAAARSSTVRDTVTPFTPRTRVAWTPGRHTDDELVVAAVYANARDTTKPAPEPTALRWTLTRTTLKKSDKGGKTPQAVWADRPATGVELDGPHLAHALAEAHRLHLRGRTATNADETRTIGPGFRAGPAMPIEIMLRFLHGELDDTAIANHLRGLLALGWHIHLPQPRSDGDTEPLDTNDIDTAPSVFAQTQIDLEEIDLEEVGPEEGAPAASAETETPDEHTPDGDAPAAPSVPRPRSEPGPDHTTKPGKTPPRPFLPPPLAVLLPFFAPADATLRVRSLWDRDKPDFDLELTPQTDWIGRLTARGPDAILPEALLRLRLAGCRPLVATDELAGSGLDGRRLAAILLARTVNRDRMSALNAITATTFARRRQIADTAPADTTDTDSVKDTA